MTIAVGAPTTDAAAVLSESSAVDPASVAVASLLLPLHGPADAVLPDANQLRRGILRVIREGARTREQGDTLAAELHRDAGTAGKPWTVSAPFVLDGGAWFRITVLGLGLGIRLGQTLRPGAALLPSTFRIGARDRWGVQIATLDSLTAGGSRRELERVIIAFLAPTTFRSADGRGHDPSPAPARLLGSWRRRWLTHLSGGLRGAVAETIAATAPGSDALSDWVSDCVELEHHALTWTQVAPAGARGAPLPTVRGGLHLLIRSPACPQRDAFRALVRFGAYAGAGRHLNVGFGQTFTAVAAAPVTIADPVRALFAAHRFG